MEKNLPNKWVEIGLGSVLQRVTNGSSLKQYEEPFNGSYPITRIETIWNETIDLTRVKYVKPSKSDIEKYGLHKGDVLFSHINSGKHIGKTVVFNLDETVIHGINLLLLRAKPFVSGFFLNYLLTHFRFSGKFMEVAQHSVNQCSINQKKLKAFVVPLPPRPEQDRLVAKLDNLMGRVEIMQKSLDRIPQLLNYFRQQVLTQAVSGKLTNVKVSIQELGKLLTDVKYGTSKKSLYDLEGTPVFRIPNIKNGEIDDSDLKFSQLDETEFNKLRLREGDVLIIRSNGSVSIVGQSAIIRKKHSNYSYAGYLIRLRSKSTLNPEYLNYSLQSNFMRSQIVETARSTSGVNNINTTEIKSLKISVPHSIEEQNAIVARIENLFSKADMIEVKYYSLKTKIDNLPQAILHKAFKGELVEQLSTDGDAKELLDEIERLKELQNEVK